MKLINAVSIITLIAAAVSPSLRAEEARLTVFADEVIGKIDRRLFGTNFIGYEPSTFEKDKAKEDFTYADYGAGVWDPARERPVKGMITLARGCGISVIRFPGGGGSNHYNWRGSVAPDRGHFLYGLDEFLQTAGEIGAEVIFTAAYSVGGEEDAAGLVEYAGGADKIKYFEIGNEVWDFEEPQSYVEKYRAYYKAMKSVDPSIQIGVILQPDNWKRWNGIVLKGVGDKADFAVVHIYTRPSEDARAADDNTLFGNMLGRGARQQARVLEDCNRYIQMFTGKDIPLAVTEYNVFFPPQKAGYRHSLGAALVNAEQLNMFMDPEYNVFMANYWQFCNSYWGMVKSVEDYTKHDYSLPMDYVKRPNYLALNMYTEHVQPLLLKSNVECAAYRDGREDIPYLSMIASRDAEGKKAHLVVINKSMVEPVTAAIELNGFAPEPKGDCWTLNGPSVSATNEERSDNVKVSHREFDIKTDEKAYAGTFAFIFEPHSLTAIELTRKERQGGQGHEE